MDNDVVHVDCNSLQPIQRHNHLSLEDLRCTGNTKRKTFKAVSSKRCDEDGQPLAAFVQWNLPEPRVQ